VISPLGSLEKNVEGLASPSTLYINSNKFQKKLQQNSCYSYQIKLILSSINLDVLKRNRKNFLKNYRILIPIIDNKKITPISPLSHKLINYFLWRNYCDENTFFIDGSFD